MMINLPYEEMLREQTQNKRVSRWLKDLGMSEYEMMNHDNLDDIHFLLKFREAYPDLVHSDARVKNFWLAYWHIVVRQNKPLKPKAFRKFEAMVYECEAKKIALEEKRDKIKLLRSKNA